MKSTKPPFDSARSDEIAIRSSAARFDLSILHHGGQFNNEQQNPTISSV
jgi:hypothetical protein